MSTPERRVPGAPNALQSRIGPAPRNVLMDMLDRYAPRAYDAVRAGQRELRPRPGANPINALASMFGADDPMSMVEGPGKALAVAKAAAPIAGRVGKAAAKRADDALTAFERSQRGRVAEREAIFNKEGKLLSQYEGESLGAGDWSIPVSERDFALAKDAIMTHNHPPGAAPFYSWGDLRAAAARDAAEIRVVDERGVLSLKRPETGWPKESSPEWSTAEREYMDAWWKQNAGLTPEKKAMEDALLTEHAFYKMGLRPRRTLWDDLDG